MTWGDGTQGIHGEVSSLNSLVGRQAGDRVGSGDNSLPGITALTNDHYVVASSYWANGTATNAGAVTWGDGSQGVRGEVNSSNSLVGSQRDDLVGDDGVLAIGNGHYVVVSSSWANGTASNAGAVTWGDGDQGIRGEVSSLNSLVGSQANDKVGDSGVTVLANGNYVVASPNWANGLAAKAGAVTWVDGSKGISGEVNSSNSLAGMRADDMVGSGGIVAFDSSDYVIYSPQWFNSEKIHSVGAATLSSGVSNLTGAISSHNSLVGDDNKSGIGDYSPKGWSAEMFTYKLSNGAVLVISPLYHSQQGRVDILALGQPSPLLYALDPGTSYNLNVDTLANLLATGAQVTLQANTDISLLDALKVSSAKGGDLTLQAGRSISLNADMHTGDGNLTLVANDTAASGVVDAHRDAGAGHITQAAGTTIDAGTGVVNLQIRDGQGIANAQAGSITLANVRAGDLQIDSHELSATLAAQDKVYDGLVDAAAAAHVTGLVFHTGSNLSLAPAAAQFSDKNVGTGKTVTAAALQITGFHGAQTSALRSDGQVLTPTAAANITPRALVVTATADNKVYDGTTAARISFSDDRVVGDVLSLSGDGNFDDKNAGVGKTVTVGDITLAGTDASNYSIGGSTATAQADITPRALDFTASKKADGSSRFDASQISLGNVIQGDQVLLSGSADVASPDVGRYSAFTVNALQSSNGNYSTHGGQVQATIVAQQSPTDPGPIWMASNVLQQEDRDFPEPPQSKLDLTVQGAKPPSEQLQQLN